MHVSFPFRHVHRVLLSPTVHVRETTYIPVASPLLFIFSFFGDFQACVVVRRCFIREIFMGGERSLSY